MSIGAQEQPTTYQGTPCLRGHIGLRYLCNKSCVECTRDRVSRYRTTPKSKEQVKKYKETNRDRLSKYHNDWHYSAAGRDSIYRRRYGVSYDSVVELIKKQDNCCAICAVAFSELNNASRLHIDHCHQSGKIRGLLCGSCNLGLGKFRDSPDFLHRAAMYLEKHRETSSCL